MTDRSQIFDEDLEWISDTDLPWERFRDRNILVTGATGLIGMTVIHALIYASAKRGLGLRIHAVVRDTAKAARVFGNLISAPELILCEGTMEKLPALPDKIEYWIHGACPTASMNQN